MALAVYFCASMLATRILRAALTVYFCASAGVLGF